MGRKIKKRWVGAMVAMVFLAGCGGAKSIEADLGTGSGGQAGTGVSNTVSAPSAMGVGDILVVDFAGGDSATVDFNGVASGAEFILIEGSANTVGSGTTIQLSTDEVASPLTKAVDVLGVEHDEDMDYGAEEIFDAWLRASEADLHLTESRGDVGGAFAKSLTKASGSDTETFRVLSSLSSSTSYVEIQAQPKCIGDTTILYVDTRVVESQLSASDISALCDIYDDGAAREIDILGGTSDVNGDSKFAIVLTPAVNNLGSLAGGIITGYFYAADLYARTTGNPTSNFREVVFALIPDPSGIYGTAIDKDFAMQNLLPAVFFHELQHAISYNQHVFVNNGSPEASWLNEAMSHVMEERMGFGRENFSRYAMFLANPSTTQLVAGGSPNLLERGASFLFLQFLREQAADGDAFLRALEQTSNTSVANVEAAFNGPDDFNQFGEFFGRWTVAMAMTDRGLTSDSRYTYRAQSFNATTGNWQGVCLSCTPDDGRGTILEGVHLSNYSGFHSDNVRASAAKYYQMSSVPNELHLEGSASGGNFAILIRTE